MGEGGLIQVLKRDSNVIGVEIGLVPLKVGGSLLTMAILNQSHMDWALLYLMSFGFYWRQHRMLPSAVGRETGIGVAIRQPTGSFDQVVLLSAKDVSEQRRQREELQQRAREEAERANRASLSPACATKFAPPMHGILVLLTPAPDTLIIGQRQLVQRAQVLANHRLGVITKSWPSPVWKQMRWPTRRLPSI